MNLGYVEYNGIRLDLVKTNYLDREPVLSSDGTTFLYLKWTHDFVAMYNPQATSYNSFGDRAAGEMPRVTDKAIRQKLAQPRGKYVWVLDDPQEPVISSPQKTKNANGIMVDAVCDMNHGPIVEALSVNEIHGTKSWAIRMVITTWINECSDSPVLLSNRFEQSMITDDQGFTTISTVGEAEFNLPKLAAYALEADDYRPKLGLPVPQGFKRINIDVAQSSDGKTVHYRFDDEQLPMQFEFGVDGENVTHIEGSYSVSFASSDMASVALGAAAGALQGWREGLSGSALRGVGRARMARKLRNIGLLSGAVANVSVPQTSRTVNVMVWGNSKSQRGYLLRIALAVAVSKAAYQLNSGVAIAASEDIMGKYVELSLTYTTGAIRGAVSSTAATFEELFDVFRNSSLPAELLAIGHSPIIALSGMLTSSDLIRVGENAKQGSIRGKLENPGTTMNLPYRHNGNFGDKTTLSVRGTWLEKLVHQSLSAQCQPPPQKTQSFRAGNAKDDPVPN